MFKRRKPRTTRTVRLPVRALKIADDIAATIDGARAGDVLEFGLECAVELMARIEGSGSAPGVPVAMAAHDLVDCYTRIVAERLGATTKPPSLFDEEDKPPKLPEA